MDLITAVVALIAALLGGGGIAAILDHRNKKKFTDIDAACKLIQQQQARIDQLTDRVNVLEAQSAIKDVRIDDLEAEIDELRDWIKEQGLTPPPRRRGRKD